MLTSVTTSCQVSQANVGRLIIGFLSEGLLLLLSQDSAGQDVVNITSGTVEFIDHWPVREPGKSRIIFITILCGGVSRSLH